MRISKIKKIQGREILDSRGNWTVEVELTTKDGVFRASVPSGASKGKYEAVALEAKKAVRNINKIIAPKLKGKDVARQKEIDEFLIKLDGTKNKSKLGANAILGVSMACCRVGAAVKNLPLWQYIRQLAGDCPSLNLPRPAFNVINGGVHAGNELDFQEFMIVPQEKIFSKNLQTAVEIYHQLKEIIKEKYIDLGINVGDEGGFAPPIRTAEEALELILSAAQKLGHQKKIKIILDVAASQFFEKGKYKTKIEVFNSEELLDYYLSLIRKYPIIALEDPFFEEDWPGWRQITSRLKAQSSKILIIGDDLTVTNPERIRLACQKKLCNAVIIKPNQIGTVSETITAAYLAKSYGWKVMVSHRSGETNDDFISDLSVGIGADFIKAGAPARGERVVKYNRLLRIEEELKK